jgi:ATP-dependent Clp protease ATP-binding subunit ClpA
LAVRPSLGDDASGRGGDGVTRDRSFKKVIRSRMRRTGESYTAARAHIERTPPTPPAPPTQRGGSGMYPFERFTERAKKVLTLAQQEAERAHLAYIGTEHLLLGLLREPGCLAAHVLAKLGVEEEGARLTIKNVLGQTPLSERITQIIPTSRVKKVIELSFEAARGMGHAYVGTEHILIGLLVEGQGIAAHVLVDLGVTLEAVRAEIDRQLRTGVPSEATAPAAPSGGTVPAAEAIGEILTRSHALAVEDGAAELGVEHLERAIAEWRQAHP